MTIPTMIDRFLRLIGIGRADVIASTLTFPQLDLERMKHRMDLERRAAIRGKDNQPDKSSTSFDDVEQDIIAEIEAEKNLAFNKYLDHQRTYGERARALGFQSLLVAIGTTTVRAEAEFAARTHDGQDHLHRQRERVLQVSKELAVFRHENRITWGSRRPSSRFLHFSVLLMVLAVEALLNGSFLAKGNELGLLGGIFQAIVIAILNVGTGFLVGWQIATRFTHRSFLWKLVGLFGVSLYFVFMLSFNLAVAHYRDALAGDNPEFAQMVALRTLQATPLTVTDINSLGLMSLGILFSLVAAADGWLFDEPYPGYGSLTARYERIALDYAGDKQELMEELEEIHVEAENAIGNAVRDIDVRKGEYQGITTYSNALQDAFSAYLDHLEQSCNNLLTFYRVENQRHRSTPSPAHFGSRWAIDRSISTNLNPIADMSREIDSVLSEAVRQVPNNQSKLAEAYLRAIQVYKNIDTLKALDPAHA